MMKKILIALVAVLFLAGCSSETAVFDDKKVTNQQLERYQAVQPVPQYDWSQYRETVIDIQDAQAHGQATTSFFFNMGVADPIFVCPSIGFPVPSTAQVTNPDQYISSGGTIPQMEPNGVYTGDSSATYAVCVHPNGTKYVKYWEGFVDAIGGPADWDVDAKRIVLMGDPTVEASTAQE